MPRPTRAPRGRNVIVSFVPTFEAWRDQARLLLARGLPPRDLEWCAVQGPPRVDAEEGGQKPETLLRARVPRAFLEGAKHVAYHKDPLRWTFLYSLLWRVVNEDPQLLHHPAESEVLRFERMRKAVWEEEAKMKAFVRFRRAQREDGEVLLAWYRPLHPILRLAAPQFIPRFGNRRWELHTEAESALWDGDVLTFRPGVWEDPALSPSAEAVEGWKESQRGAPLPELFSCPGAPLALTHSST